MCVTNTTQSRMQAFAFPPAQMGMSPSLLSQRLMGTLGGACPPASAPFSTASLFTASAYNNSNNNELMSTLESSTMPRSKRRRKPQKPGKTAKMNDRHFVKHDYHDHANDADDETEPQSDESHHDQRRRGGVAIAFPLKLHAVLLQVEVDGLSHIVSWQPHGRCFVIHKPKEFVDLVMPQYFRQTKLTSFQRQLNLYGFQRLTRGPDAGGYYHECFLRGKEFLCKKMTRTKVKGTKFKAASSPEQEPDFYQMPPVATVTPHHSSDEEMSFDSNRGLEQQSQPTSAFSYFPSLNAPTSAPEPQPFYSQPSLGFSVSPIATSASASAPTVASSLLPGMNMLPMDANRVLDEAVDELFLSDVRAGDDNLADFVQDWDPSNNFQSVLEDDAQLGFMLDKLLED